MKSRHFLITDIDEKMIVEETTRKDILGYIDEHLENIEYGNDMSDYAFRILYKDGSTDEVSGNDYDGHKIKRINISSIVVDNPCTCCCGCLARWVQLFTQYVLVKRLELYLMGLCMVQMVDLEQQQDIIALMN